MNDEQLQTLEQVNRFLEGSEALEFRGPTTQEKYCWIKEMLLRFKYHCLKRDEKGVIRRYIERITGYSRAQVSRLIGRYKQTWHGNISGISVAHLHNLRRGNTSRNIARRFTRTKPVVSRIGELAKPDPQGQPGYIQIDTVHQGDFNEHKGGIPYQCCG